MPRITEFLLLIALGTSTLFSIGCNEQRVSQSGSTNHEFTHNGIPSISEKNQSTISPSSSSVYFSPPTNLTSYVFVSLIVFLLKIYDLDNLKPLPFFAADSVAKKSGVLETVVSERSGNAA